MDFVPYAIPFFILAMLFEFAWGVHTGNNTYRLNDTINSLSCGVLSTTIKLLGIDYGAHILAAVGDRFAVSSFSSDNWSTWVIGLLVYDFCYYWAHRIGHERQLFWASHVVHHQSEEFNLSTALRQTSSGFLFGWIFYTPSFVLGIPVDIFVSVASIHLIYQFWIHSRHIPKLGPFEWLFVSASNHRVHHAQNPEYVDRNYGGLLIIWDRLFGTFEEENENNPPVYGILGPLHSWNPLWANLHIYAAMWRDAMATQRLHDRLRVLWARTGWHPPIDGKQPVAKPGLDTFQRYDPPMTVGRRRSATALFLLCLGGGLALMFGAAEAPWTLRAGGFALLLLGFIATGKVMEVDSAKTATE